MLIYTINGVIINSEEL